MPSSATRQRLPAELWRNPRSSSQSPVLYSNQIQAHPGDSELFAASKNRDPACHNLVRRQFTPSNRKKKRVLHRRGSSDDILVHSDSDSNNGCETVRVSVSACSDSESGVGYNSSIDCRDCYASDSFKAPAVNVLPLPPTKWLGSSFSKNSDRVHAMNEASLQLQAFLGLVPADRRV